MNKNDKELELEDVLEQFDRLDQRHKDKLLTSAKQQINKVPELAILLGEYKKLNREHKNEVFGRVIGIIHRELELQEQEQKEKRCVQTRGHEFGNWYYHSHREFDPTKYRNGKYVWKEQWTRYCLRCGFTETVTKKPKEYDEQMQKINRRPRERMYLGGRRVPL